MRQPTVMFRMVIAMALGAAARRLFFEPYPPAPASAATSDYRYVIGPLDTVNIVVWRNPELSMSVPVRPDGRISTPLVEDIPALGKNPAALGARPREGAVEVHPRPGRHRHRQQLQRAVRPSRSASSARRPSRRRWRIGRT